MHATMVIHRYHIPFKTMLARVRVVLILASSPLVCLRFYCAIVVRTSRLDLS